MAGTGCQKACSTCPVDEEIDQEEITDEPENITTAAPTTMAQGRTKVFIVKNLPKRIDPTFACLCLKSRIEFNKSSAISGFTPLLLNIYFL